MSVVGPYARQSAVVADPTIPASVRKALLTLDARGDANEVWAPPDADLARVCNCAGTKVVRLYADTVYRTNLLWLQQPVTIIGYRSSVVEPQPNYTGTRKVQIALATKWSGVTDRVILKGFTCKLPIEASDPCRVEDVEVTTALTTTHGAKVELLTGADGSAIVDCVSPDTDALGILIRPGVTKARCHGTDFSGHTTAVEVTVADFPNLGPDTNVGTIVLH